MPRSGSTLLANILNQNPRFWATPTSGLCPLMMNLNHAWNNISELRASAYPEDKLKALRGLMDGFHSRISRPVVLDKSRGWVSNFELLQNVLGTAPKMLVTYRDIPSILSSCEKLFRRETSSPNAVSSVGQEMMTIEGRLAHWTDGAELVGGAYNRIRDCVVRGNRAGLHFVNFDDLVSSPERVLQGVYSFLGEEYFAGHDFARVVQSTHENDAEHGFVDLHTIRPEVAPVRKDFREVLGAAVNPYLQFQYDFIS